MQNVDGTMSTLVLVSSPFQYLCAVEFLKCRDIAGPVIIIDGSSHCINSAKQLSALYSAFPPTQLINIKLLKQGDLTDRIASYSWIANDLVAINFGVVLIGDIREQWMQDIACSVSSQEIMLVDDGAATLVLHDFVLKPNGFLLPMSMYKSDPVRRDFAMQIKKAQGLLLQQKKVSIFSIYDFGSASAGLKNEFRALMNGFSALEHDEWHFIGSPVVEKGIISKALYNKAVEDALFDSPVSARAIYYVHRSEDMTLKQHYLTDLGYEIRTNDLPYELHLVEQSMKPRWIAGLHSTCLFNLKLMFGTDFPARCYVLNSQELERMKTIQWASDHYSLYDHIVSIYSRLDEFGIEAKMFQLEMEP
jgi:hypothetical protein